MENINVLFKGQQGLPPSLIFMFITTSFPLPYRDMNILLKVSINFNFFACGTMISDPPTLTFVR